MNNFCLPSLKTNTSGMRSVAEDPFLRVLLAISHADQVIIRSKRMEKYYPGRGGVLMKILLNNREYELKDCEEITLKELLYGIRFYYPHIIAKINGKVLRDEELGSFLVHNEDKVVAFVSSSGG
jgi:sulfur carrier protein ThiS